jgi:hypothetical protein
MIRRHQHQPGLSWTLSRCAFICSFPNLPGGPRQVPANLFGGDPVPFELPRTLPPPGRPCNPTREQWEAHVRNHMANQPQCVPAQPVSPYPTRPATAAPPPRLHPHRHHPNYLE